MVTWLDGGVADVTFTVGTAGSETVAVTGRGVSDSSLSVGIGVLYAVLFAPVPAPVPSLLWSDMALASQVGEYEAGGERKTIRIDGRGYIRRACFL